MDLDGARSALAGSRFADLRHVVETGSTNADVLEAARRGDPEHVLVADHQTAGRGRLDRRWEAPPRSSLLMSVLVREPSHPDGLHALPHALGVAAVDALRASDGVSVGLKWPNDLVVAGAGGDGVDLKVGGLLSELHSGPPAAVVLGIGVNLSWSEVPEHLVGVATAIELVGGRVDRWELVVAVLTAFERELAEPAGALGRYRERCVTLGRRVRVELSHGVVEGTAHDIAPDGALVVRTDEGREHVVTVGDVVHLRPV